MPIYSDDQLLRADNITKRLLKGETIFINEIIDIHDLIREKLLKVQKDVRKILRQFKEI